MAIPATPSRRKSRVAEFGSSDYVIIAGSFEVNGTGEVTNVKGEGFKVTRTGVGVFDITVHACIGKGLISCVATAQADTANTIDDIVVQVGTYTKSTGLLELFTHDVVATPALTDLDGPRVNFVAVFHDKDTLDVTYTA